tara:strand:- start:482 stop:826 length:345 start_codon:yes stop_codon:yes gene_type:complete
VLQFIAINRKKKLPQVAKKLCCRQPKTTAQKVVNINSVVNIRTVGRRGVEDWAVVSIYIYKQPLKKILPSRGFPAVVLYLLPDHITPTTMVVLLMAINLMTAFTLTWGSLLFNE